MQKFQAFAFEKKTDLEVWLQSLNLDTFDFIRLASSFGVGFLCGLVVKRYFKYIILIGISLVIFLAILQSFAIVTINIGTIQKLTGLQDITNIGNIYCALVLNAKKYTLELGCSGIGFILGLKIG